MERVRVLEEWMNTWRRSWHGKRREGFKGEKERENCGKDLSVGSLIGAKDWDCCWKKYFWVGGSISLSLLDDVWWKWLAFGAKHSVDVRLCGCYRNHSGRSSGFVCLPRACFRRCFFIRLCLPGRAEKLHMPLLYPLLLLFFYLLIILLSTNKYFKYVN